MFTRMVSEVSDTNTIAAIATGAGEAGIAIVRMSGPESVGIADRVFRGGGQRPSQRAGGTFLYGAVHSGEEELDEVILVVFRAPHSYTREDTVEIPIQVNGKLRTKMEAPSTASREALERMALEQPRVKELLGERSLVKVIVVPGRLVNLVMR